MKLQAGNSYLNRKGEVIIVSENEDNLNFPFIGRNRRTGSLLVYREDGKYLTSGISHSDIISEYNETKRHPHADMIIEWAETGKEVECFNSRTKTWLRIQNPTWGEDIEYRFKPEPFILDFDWDCLPKWADRWIAMGILEQWVGYKDEPHRIGDSWVGNTKKCYPTIEFFPKNFIGDWTESLFENPKYKTK